ncbi:hypothetical protein DPMN_097478 [Dreissena polymorpha]|uniref:Uncharacterized protein n=1 Tax=Dreissena polymorpha TaxID=45954 RepID=A0A9D4LAB8_DREPO|nr:hypothetical protein DPMN_097478 [Dreissena polymorpha]
MSNFPVGSAIGFTPRDLNEAFFVSATVSAIVMVLIVIAVVCCIACKGRNVVMPTSQNAKCSATSVERFFVQKP